ncbi:hypothetical protein RCZ04_04240 [Capnocytophaga sp. HP1101]
MFKYQNQAQSVNNSNAVQNQRFANLLRSIKPADNLLDYKLKHLTEVLRDTLETLHDGISEDEPTTYLLNQVNKVMALFEMLVGLLPEDSEYFQSVTLVCDELLTQKCA